MILRTKLYHLLVAVLFFTLAACGGGGGGGGGTPAVTVLQGNFIDSAVEGMAYTSGSESGLTSATGAFSYESGQTVTFSIGDIVIGTANGTPVITPVQLFTGATSEANLFVTNVARFLLTIDDDRDPANGIQITQAIRDAAAGLSVNFRSTNIAAFETDTDVINAVAALTTASSFGIQSLVSFTAAQTHLAESLRSLLNGTYSGTFSGSDTGTWTITIAADGTITGSGNASGGATLVITGNVATSGSITGSSGWSGSFDIASETVSGTWAVTISGAAYSGTYSGSKN